MTCMFNFKIPDDPVAILDMIRPMIEQAGGTVSGESANVTFSIPTTIGRFDGACKVIEASTIQIAVTDKPELVTCTMVRQKLVFYITEAVKLYRQQAKAAARQPATASQQAK